MEWSLQDFVMSLITISIVSGISIDYFTKLKYGGLRRYFKFRDSYSMSYVNDVFNEINKSRCDKESPMGFNFISLEIPGLRNKYIICSLDGYVMTSDRLNYPEFSKLRCTKELTLFDDRSTTETIVSRLNRVGGESKYYVNILDGITETLLITESTGRVIYELSEYSMVSFNELMKFKRLPGLFNKCDIMGPQRSGHILGCETIKLDEL